MTSRGLFRSDNSTIVRSIHGGTRTGRWGGADDPGGLVRLADGARVRLRPVRPDDEGRLEALFHRLSAETVFQRFFTTHRRLPAAWYRSFANVDYRRRFAVVAERDRLVLDVSKSRRRDPGARCLVVEQRQIDVRVILRDVLPGEVVRLAALAPP